MTWFVLATCSALLSAAAAVTQKRVLFRIDSLQFSFLVSGVILAVSAFTPIVVPVASVPPTTLAIIAGKSVLGAMAFLFVMMSLEHNQISSALPFLGLTPAITALLALPVLGESLHGLEWAGIGLMVLGTFILENKPGGNPVQLFNQLFTSRNHAYIFAALGLFAVSSVADKLLVSNYRTDPLVVLFYQHCVYCLMFGGLLWIRGKSFRALAGAARDQLPLIAAVAVLTLAYRFTQLEATKTGPVALVLAVKRTSIVYASFFGGRLFSDDRLSWKVAGAALIVGAGFLILRNAA